MGQEGSCLDFESKSLHAGMLDHVGMEVGDIAQIVGFNYPTSVANTPLVDLGWDSVDKTKPIICFVGHNPATSTVVIDYLRDNDLYDKVEVCGVCCTALETTRYSDRAKVIGPYSRQLFYVRSGIADVIMTDEQCIRTDMPQEATKAGSALIATLDKVMYGLEDATDMNTDEIVKKMVEEKKHFAILDGKKAAEVAVKVAMAIAPQRRKGWLTEQEATELAQKCSLCGICEQACPNLFDIGSGVSQVAKGNYDMIREIFNLCVGCGKCEEECPRNLPIMKIMQVGASKETWKIRAGRGPIMDTEIRTVGAPITLGTIPGVVAFVGCSNFPDIRDLAEMVDEFARRKYIVVVSGCTAMAVGMWKDADGKTIYEKYPGDFDAGCVVNVGSCVANSHIAGAAIKIANIFAALPLRANYEVMADYVLNRVGAVGIAWGAYSQKAASIGTGFNRLGVPVILGPHSSKYRRLYLSRKDEDEWKVMDARKRQIVETNEPSPEHLAYVCETKEKAMVMIPKLCIRKNDTPQGRGDQTESLYLPLQEVYGRWSPRRPPSLCEKRCGHSNRLQKRGQGLSNSDRLETERTGRTSHPDWNLSNKGSIGFSHTLKGGMKDESISTLNAISSSQYPYGNEDSEVSRGSSGVCQADREGRAPPPRSRSAFAEDHPGWKTAPRICFGHCKDQKYPHLCHRNSQIEDGGIGGKT